jgi:hypothetical protein
MSRNYEKEFRAKYPHARVMTDRVCHSLVRYTVYAGDYICAESVSRATAFRVAFKQAEFGTITPEPTEQSVNPLVHPA